MIYATEHDARLSKTIRDFSRMWQLSGPTSMRQLEARGVEVGLAVPTVAIEHLDYSALLGTRVNSAIPLAIQGATPAAQVLTPADMLNTIREAFGLNVTQLAQALQVQRITVYDWMKADAIEKLHESNRNRLVALHDIAVRWQTYEPIAGRYLLEKLSTNQRSLMDLLCQDYLHPAVFEAAYAELAKATAPTIRMQRHRAEQRAAGKKGVDALLQNMDKLGLDLS